MLVRRISRPVTLGEPQAASGLVPGGLATSILEEAVAGLISWPMSFHGECHSSACVQWRSTGGSAGILSGSLKDGLSCPLADDDSRLVSGRACSLRRRFLRLVSGAWAGYMLQGAIEVRTASSRAAFGRQSRRKPKRCGNLAPRPWHQRPRLGGAFPHIRLVLESLFEPVAPTCCGQ